MITNTRRICLKLGLWFFIPALVLSAVTAGADETSKADANDPNSIMKRFTVSKETTFIKGPRHKDGTINYVGWLKQHFGKGLTHKNNAAVLIVKALGPEIIPAQFRDAYRKELRLKLPSDGDYFQDHVEYAREAGLGLNRLDQALHRAKSEPWTAKKYPDLAKWLKRNAAPLALMEQATTRTHYLMPIVAEGTPPEMISILLPSLSRIRYVAKAMGAEAMRKLGSGDAAGASADLIRLHRLGRLVGRGPTLIARLVGLAIDQIAVEGDRTLLQDPGVKVAVLKDHLAELGKLPEIPSMAESIDKSERLMGLDITMVFIRGGVSPNKVQMLQGLGNKAKGKGPSIPSWMIDWDIVLKRFNDEYDRLVEIARAKTYDRLNRLNAALDKRIEKLGRKVTPGYLAKQIALSVLSSRKKRRERIGRAFSDFLISILLPSLGRATVLERSQELSVDLARVGFALRLHQEAHGKLPGELSALTPKYIKKLPGDWFSAKKLIYRRSKDGKGFLVYSVGPDGIDQGGRIRGEGGDGETEPDDIRVWYQYGEQEDK